MRTQLQWLGATLVTRATPVREDVDPATGIVNLAVGVTTVEAYMLLDGGARMIVEHSGERSKIPPTLHGLPYDPKSDPLVQKYTDTFSRTAR